MKKILIATTALVATAGVAAADVAVSGNGRMGVVYNGDDLNFSSRIRVVFTATGETDGGLQFGGTFRADKAGQAASGTHGNIYISGAFGKLAMGDTLGAAETVLGDLPEIGYQDLSSQVPVLTLADVGISPAAFTALSAADQAQALADLAGLNALTGILAIGKNDIAYITGDNEGKSLLSFNTGPNALYTYSTGGLTFALSMNDGKAGMTSVDATQEYALGVKYAMDAYSVSLGYEVADPVVGNSAKHLIIGGEAKFADTTVKAFYGDGSGAISGFKQYGVGVTSVFDAITVKGYVKKTEIGAADVVSYGLGGEYSLGGGAAVAFGIADNDINGSKAVADFGLKFTF